MFNRRWALILLATVLGCTENPQAPEPPAPEPLPDSSPAAVLRTISTLFNDRQRPAVERSRLYDQLFAPEAAVFICPSPPARPTDCPYPFRPDQAREVFEGLENGTLHAMNVELTHGAAILLDPPEPGREDWQEIFVTNLYLRVLINLEDGYETNGGMAKVLFEPRTNDQWVIAEWTMMGRPLVTRTMSGR